MLTVTAGKEGSWCWNGSSLKHFPAAETRVVSTAGAGDAFFAGILTGISLGLDLFESQQLATLVASHSVSSPHTINKETGRDSLRKLSQDAGIRLSSGICKLLEE